MVRGDERELLPEPDGIGPEAAGADDGRLDLEPFCPHCGRPMPYSDEGVLVRI